MKKAAVIGTGMMGPGIACRLAVGGVDVSILSRTPEGAERGLASAGRALSQLADNGLVPAADAGAARTRITSTCDVEAAVRDAELVVESVPESMPLKQELFSRLESLTSPRAVLASNTSGLSITVIASTCKHPERVLTAHFWNPPHLMPLVELVRGDKTSPAVLDAVRDLLARCGLVPVLVKKDRPGQLGNRMQMALVREAVHIVAEGIADAEDVDRAARLGFGLRLPAYGVLEHLDMVGLELGYAVCDYVCRDLNNEPKAPGLFQQKIARGEKFLDWSNRTKEQIAARRDAFVIDCLRRGLAR